MTLTDLLDSRLRRDLDIIYGPDWSIAVNGHLEIVPGPPRWMGMTEDEREAERQRIVDLWRKKGWNA